MDIQALLIGMGVAPIAQATKADGWSRWIQVGYPIALAAGLITATSNGQPNTEAIITAALSALATHSAILADTPVGKALKWNLLGVVLDGIGNVFKGLVNKEDKP